MYQIEDVTRFKSLDVDNGEVQNYEGFDEFLDDSFPIIILGMHYQGSRVLQELDPIAYNVAYNDFMDSVQSEFEQSFEDEDFTDMEFEED